MINGFVRVAAATPQIKVGDVPFNGDNIIRSIADADKSDVSLIVFPELSLTGYTAGDLFFSQDLLKSVEEELRAIALKTEALNITALVGLPFSILGKLYNVAAVINRGRVIGLVGKTNIPNYGEFYERRWFTPAPSDISYITIAGFERVPFGRNIVFCSREMELFRFSIELCEDLWVPLSPSVESTASGALIVANLSASDELVGKEEYRGDLVRLQSAKTISAYIYADAGEGESTSDMVFTGNDYIAENGTILSHSQYTSGSFITAEVDLERLENERRKTNTYRVEKRDEESYVFFSSGELHALTLKRKFSPYPFVPSLKSERERRSEKILTLQALGLKRRMQHTAARCAVIGLSGGLDSTLALLVTVRAFDLLSKSRADIIAVTMPCFGTTKRTKSNAELLSSALGVTFMDIDIRKSVISHFNDIGQSLDDLSVTYENGQARERTQVLMDIANKNGGLVIGTGDLSELALGWATYNGDHMSMYGVNAGVPKTLVRYLVSYTADKTGGEVKEILKDILSTPVSPELLPAKNGEISQVTEDIVGPYELHDFFLYYFVRHGFSVGKIYRIACVAFTGIYSEEAIKRWLRVFIKRFFSQQFKRNCLPDGPKVGTITLSPRSDWRMPSDAAVRVYIKDVEEL